MMSPEAPTKTGVSLSVPQVRSLIDKDSAQVYNVNLQRIFVRPCPTPVLLDNNVNEVFCRCQQGFPKKMNKQIQFSQFSEIIEILIEVFCWGDNNLFAKKIDLPLEWVEKWRHQSQEGYIDIDNDKNLQTFIKNFQNLHPIINPAGLAVSKEQTIPLPRDRISHDLRLRRIRNIYWELEISKKDLTRKSGVEARAQHEWFSTNPKKTATKIGFVNLAKLYIHAKNISKNINPEAFFNAQEPLWIPGTRTRFTREIKILPLRYMPTKQRIQATAQLLDIDETELANITGVAKQTANKYLNTEDEKPNKKKPTSSKGKQKHILEQCLLKLREYAEEKLQKENKQLNLEWFYFGTGEPYTHIEQQLDIAANEPYLDFEPETTQSISYDSQHESSTLPDLQTQEPQADLYSLLQTLRKTLKPLMDNKENYLKIRKQIFKKHYHPDSKDTQDLPPKVLSELQKTQKLCKDDELSDSETAEEMILVLEYFYGPFFNNNPKSSYPFLDRNKEENSG